MPKLAENPHRNANGKWYFRLRIPQDLLGKIEGHGFGKTDYRISLKTRDEAEAKRRSKEAHKKFVATIELKREELKASQSGKAKAAIFNRFEYDLRQRGIHPSQAPKVTASQEDQKKYWDAYHSFIYGDWDQEAQTLDGGLDVLITELASNHDYSRSSEDLKALKEAIAERDAALAFMQGRIGSDAEITITDGRRFVGKLQFGEARLRDYQRATGTTFTQDEFKADTALQDRVAAWHLADIDKAISGLGDAASGYDRDGLRAVAHLGGVSGMKRFVRSKGEYNPADELGTSLQSYYDKFSARGQTS